MSYYTSYSTAPQDKVKEIKERLANSERSKYISMRLQRNPHDFGEYLSLEIDWIHGNEYSNLEYYDEEEEIDNYGTTAEQRLCELDDELEKLHKMEEVISEKFGERL